MIRPALLFFYPMSRVTRILFIYYETYTFDMRTGEMLTKEITNIGPRLWLTSIPAIFLSLVGFILSLLVWIIRRAKPRKLGM